MLGVACLPREGHWSSPGGPQVPGPFERQGPVTSRCIMEIPRSALVRKAAGGLTESRGHLGGPSSM